MPLLKQSMETILCPLPQQIEWTEERWEVPASLRVYLADAAWDKMPLLGRLVDAWQKAGVPVTPSAYSKKQGGRWEAEIVLSLAPERMVRAQGYRLSVEKGGITIAGADEAGLFYGVCTLCQWIDLWAIERENGATAWPGVIVTDWPTFRDRGVMLDISRDKVPTMDTLFALVDQLATWKINQIQLYMEHTFAYEGHEDVWEHADPMTGAQILELDAYCRERHVELVPNQNSFGHMHRWLIHEKYNHLAECPEGVDHPFSPNREPYSLCPTDPESLALLDDLYQQLLPHFRSSLFNVGLDETFDIGLGRSKELADDIGSNAIYIQFLQAIHKKVKHYGKTIQFWADIVLQQPEKLAELPDDGIAMIWGYEDSHPFEEQCQLFARLGLAHYVCPGTSSWNSWAGRTTNTLGNLSNASVSGSDSGALGFLITDWGDFGHMQPLPSSYLGFLAGACMAWKKTDQDSAMSRDWIGLLNHHVFQDTAEVAGEVAYHLGDAYKLSGGPTFNASPLFRILVLHEKWPPSKLVEKGLTEDGLDQALSSIQQARDTLQGHKMQRSDASLVHDEFLWCADVMALACRFGLARLSSGSDDLMAIPEEDRQSLADGIEEIVGRHEQNWLQRNRPGGFQDSAQHLRATRKALLGEDAS